MCDYESMESVNDVLYQELHELVQTPFFKYFRVRRLAVSSRPTAYPDAGRPIPRMSVLGRKHVVHE